ncbi:Ser Thr kinase Kin1 [Tubulinosema ratisbonensis]|uniref:Ser Thr kinase Kin1 n=1 Tax=Tubulinosema ratisbonensis TaxID=291195 RepID=A0A437ANE5_9MICR|nr:Ser Thr kinase Kin1 [Tubulinosema ratisbonensis]
MKKRNLKIEEKKKLESKTTFRDETTINSQYNNESLFKHEIGLVDYTILNKIGTGSSSDVKLGINKFTKEKVAIKIVPRKKANPAMAKEREEKREIRILRETVISLFVRHPNIVRLIDFNYDENYFYLIFEYAEGFQLYDLILESGRMSEIDCRRIFRQIISAVVYIHKNGVAHRDLKIENILVDINGNVKLIDFGLANFYDELNGLRTFCGSLYFAAPELLKGYIYKGNVIDVWSLGVILYTMACGFVPFDDKSIYVLQEKIKNSDYQLPKHLSLPLKNLISKMLTKNFQDRIDLEEIIEDEWLNENYSTKIETYFQLDHKNLKFDEQMMNLLANVLDFQFDDIVLEIQDFFVLSKEEKKQRINKKAPILVLYKFISENKEMYSEIEIDDIIKSESVPEKIKLFVDLILKNELCKKGREMQNISILEQRHFDSTVNVYPEIRRSFLKGIFKGIFLPVQRTEEELRNFIERFCMKKDIKFWIIFERKKF